MNNDSRSKRNTVKNRRRKAKTMLSSSHILIACVAIIECLIMLVFTTYSWIETSSSLVIMNGTNTTSIHNTMPIAKALNYHYTIPASGSVNPGSSDPDLGANFSYVKYFQFAKASSADGKSIYFPNSGAAHAAYRLGDTTDYNTSYIYFDVEVQNLKSTTQGFYFTNANTIFSIENTNLTDTQKKDVLNAMRLSIQTDNDRPAIYARKDEGYTSAINAVNATDGSMLATSVLKLSDYASSASDADKLFTVTSNNSTKVSFRIWLEMKDLLSRSSFSGAASDSTVMKNLYDTAIKVDFTLGYNDSTSVRFYFNDYSFQTVGDHKGEHLTTLTNDYIMYFYDGGEQKYYPMTLSASGSQDVPATWVTANSTGTASATIPESKVRYNNGSPGSIVSDNGKNNSFFIYALNNQMSQVGGSTAPPGIVYKWKLDGRRAPYFESNDKYIFNGYSVANTGNTAGTAANGNGLGDWNSNTTAVLMQFKDNTTAWNGSNNYNVGNNNTKIIENNDNAGIHVYFPMYDDSNSSISAYNTPKSIASFYKDDSDDYFKGYVPSSWIHSENTLDIFYFSGTSSTYGVYSASSNSVNGVNCTMRWSAANPESNIYTALGYTDDSAVGSITGSAKKQGIGTWKDTVAVSFDSELIETDLKNTNKYKISFNNTDFYHMVGNEDRNTFTAYVPIGNNLTFKRIDSNNSVVSWYGGEGRRAYDDTVFYATSLTSNTAGVGTGLWHIAVVADGTFEHLVYDTVVTGYTDSEGSPAQGVLQFSFDGVNFAGNNLERLDDYRWYVPDVDADTHTIWYRWIPYSGSIFEYRHDLSDGIYFVIVEGADDSYFTAP
ncbi:hypothetical protein [Ruminococcus sp.]|uniref:hypothetical protein n=1 Tax=Ruminococcus sp. TaxID=41978 RepID=UPI0038677D09